MSPGALSDVVTVYGTLPAPKGVRCARTVRQLHLPLLEDFEPELQAHMLGNAEKHGARVGKRLDLQWRKRRVARVAELE